MAFLLLFIIMSSDLAPQPENPVDPKWWECSPEAAEEDAYIIKEELKLRDKTIEHYLLIRVLTTNGRSIFDTIEFPESLMAFKGRVLHKKGSHFPLTKEGNLKKKLILQTREKTNISWSLVPSGLTSDCIVEIYWELESEAGLPKDEQSMRYPIQSFLFCEEKKIYIWKAMDKYSKLLYQDSLFPIVTRFVWDKCPPTIQFRQQILGDDMVLSYKNIPKILKQPYGSKGHDQQSTAFRVFKTIPFDDMSAKDFWHNFCSVYIRFQFDFKQNHGKHYVTWIKELKQNMPDHSLNGAVYVQNQFKTKIQSLDFLCSEKKEKLPRRLNPSQPGDMNGEFLNTMFLNGYASNEFMTFLLLQVMEDCGLPVKVMYARSVYDAPFMPESFDPFSLRLDHPFLLLPRQDQSFYYFAPTFPEVPSGYLPPQYTGVRALVVNPKDLWEHWFLEIPRDSWSRHQLINKLNMDFEENTIHFSQITQGSGQFDSNLRRSLFGIPDEEQRELILDEKRRLLPGWEISGVNVAHVEAPEDRIVFGLRGQKDVPPFENWMSFAAFPGIELPLELPNTWALPRTQPFIFPHSFLQMDKTILRLPAGFSLKGFPQWKQSNDVGEVSLSIENDGSRIILTRLIKLKQSLCKEDMDPQVSQFLAWIRIADQPGFSVERRVK